MSLKLFIKTILSLILFFATSTLSAQLEITKNTNSSFDTINNLINLRFSVINNTPTDIDYHWVVETQKPESENWETRAIYDQLICYAPGNISSFCDIDPNRLTAGGSFAFYRIEIEVFEGFIEGCLTWHLLDFCLGEQTDTLASVTCKFNKDMFVSSTASIELEPKRIFPNPTQNTFSISNDDRPLSISVYDQNGLLVRNIMHFPGMQHDVSNFSRGIYLLNIRGIDGQSYRVTKLLITH